MMGVPMMTEKEYSGQNLQAFKVMVYEDYFLISGQEALTGISSRIRIDKTSRNITQLGKKEFDLDLEEPTPPKPDNQILCSCLLGILPIYHRHFLLLVELCKTVCRVEGRNLYEVEKVIFLPLEAEEVEGSEAGQNVLDIKNYLKYSLLSKGYYFAFRYDLSLSRSAHAAGFPSKKKFFWNHSIGKNFAKLEDSRWFVGLIQGSVRSFKMTIEGTVLKYVLITRRSWAKGGTRFNSRGIDLKGNVANFCETEQLLFAKGQVFSHVQVRGSVPVFWKQEGLNQTVEVDSEKERNEGAFRKHIDKLIANYERIFCINLLCLDRRGEDELTYYFQKLVKENNYKQVRYEYFDVHCASKDSKFERCNYLVTQKLQGIIKFFAFYQEDQSSRTVTGLQHGVFRLNCLDNLDRTNLIQSKIAYSVLTEMLKKAGIDVVKASGSQSLLVATNDIETRFIFVIHLKNAWADNGDMLSNHYTGTGSTHTDISRKGGRDYRGKFGHFLTSCKRVYQQLVDDHQKQQAIDILLCEHTATVNLQEIEDRLKELQAQRPQDFPDYPEPI